MSEDEKLITLYPEYDPDPDVVYPYTPGLDNSSVRCICNIPFDDGATIQCDGCWVWQHMICMEIDRSCIPKVYYCEECRERPVDVQKAIVNQEKMQKQRRSERVSVIKEILIKKGILDKPSPRKKKESRGRKVVQSPKRGVKPVKQKVVEQQSPLANAPITTGNNRIVVPEFPFRDIVCLDDWTDGFMGRGSEKIKKSTIENPFDAEYADWAVNCAKVQGNQFIGVENAVRDFIAIVEKVAPEWNGGALPSNRDSVAKPLGEKEDSIDDDTYPKDERSPKQQVHIVYPKSENASDDQGEDAKLDDRSIIGKSGESLETMEPREEGSIGKNEDTSMDLDDGSNEIVDNTVVAGSPFVKTEESAIEGSNLKCDDKIDHTENEGSTANDTTQLSEDLTISTAVKENQIDRDKLASCVLVTNRRCLITAPVRYSVDLISITEENQIPYYGLFSTCTIPAKAFICSTFGTLSDVANLNASLLPCKLVQESYVLPPFTIKVLQEKNWILDCRTRGDIAGRYIRRSCSAISANAALYCMIVKEETVLNEKLVFGIFSTKEIPAGQEIILSTPGCHSFPCACSAESKCAAKEHFANIAQTCATNEGHSPADKKEIKVHKRINKNGLTKKKLPMFLQVLVLSHQKKIKALKAQKIQEPPIAVSVPTKKPSIQIPKEPILTHSRSGSGSVARRKPPPSPAIESPKALSREERKLKEQLALFEKMEQQDKKKRKRRTHGEPSAETASPTSKKDYEESEEENYTGSSSKVDNETSESIGRDSPASVMDLAEKHEDEPDYKRKLDSIPTSEPLVFKKPKLENSEKIVQNTPAPLVRKLSLRDFLQKRNQNKTPSPSSSNQLLPTDNPTT